ncbi:MAG: MoaD/ThiS family protein [Promethearchaeota archaeon]
MVEVLYFAKIRDITQKDREFFHFKKKKIKDFLLWIIKKYPPLKDIFWEDENLSLKSSISIAINHKIIRNKDLLSIDLIEGDTVAFLLPISGG